MTVFCMNQIIIINTNMPLNKTVEILQIKLIKNHTLNKHTADKLASNK